MDSFEDFEFKPLTDGLGFHKKTNNSQNTMSPINANSSLQPEPSIGKKELPKDLSFDLPDINPIKINESLDKEVLEKKMSELPIEAPQDVKNLFIQKPLPREGEVKPKQTLQIPKFQGPRFAKSLTETSHLSFLEDKNEIKAATVLSNRIGTEIRYKYTETSPSLLSIFLDSTVIAGLSILFAMSLVAVTGVDLVKVMSNPMSLGTQIGIALLIFSVAQLYYILARVFFGQTLGEWSLEHQVGLKQEQEKLSYVFKLIYRSLAIMFTGFIVLPLVSRVTKKDIAGRISKLKMYRQDQV